MVTFTEWTSIVFEVAKERGLDTSVQSNNQQTVSTLSAIWNERKAELEASSAAAAREIAEEEISVPRSATRGGRSIRGP